MEEARGAPGLHELDRWIVETQAALSWSEAADRRLRVRLDMEASPLVRSRVVNGRRMLGCAALAALVGFAATGAIQAEAGGARPERWPSAMMHQAPSALLISDR